MVEAAVLPARSAQRRIRLPPGRRAGCLHAAVRSAPPPSLSGRDQCSTDRREAHAVVDCPWSTARFDYEYERNGVCALFMLNEPLRGWREVVVTDQRTAIDFAHVIKHLVDIHYPNADKIVLVMDNLNTHRARCSRRSSRTKPGD